MIEKHKQHIQSHLKKLEKEHDIMIILAIESGSRAWGFPSKDSDFDVRFIYAHKQEHYLRIDDQRDVIETPIHHDPVLGAEFDMNGWDIKKAIQLAMRGNSVVNEWLSSPIRYIENSANSNKLQKFISEVTDLRAYFHFYRNYMRAPWESYNKQTGPEIKIKHYCYCLRCALALEWLENKKSPPPMDVPSLMKGLELDLSLLAEIDQLIAVKAESTESENIIRKPILDNFINTAISQDRKRPPKDELQSRNIEKANSLFRDIISCA